MKENNTIASAIDMVRRGHDILKDTGVISHQKQVHVELSEWVTAQLFNGDRATSGNQKNWDVVLPDGQKVQVKSHAKALTNPSNWTTLSKSCDGVSFIFII